MKEEYSNNSGRNQIMINQNFHHLVMKIQNKSSIFKDI